MKRMKGLGLVVLIIVGLLAARSTWLGRGWIIDLSTGAADLTVHGHSEEHIGQAVAAGDINADSNAHIYAHQYTNGNADRDGYGHTDADGHGNSHRDPHPHDHPDVGAALRLPASPAPQRLLDHTVH